MIKLLVSIPNYGDQNLKFLDVVIDEYKSYKNYDVTINVHSTVPIPRKDINVIKYDPNSGTMLYKHRQEFVDKQDDYDLFLAADNDILIKEEAIDLYMKYDKVLPANHVLGFIAYEKYENDDNLYLFHQWPTAHHESVKFNTEDRFTGTSYITDKDLVIGDQHYFMLTNVCQQCYLLTRDKLKLATATPGFLRTDWPVLNKETAMSGIFTTWAHADGILYKVHTRNMEDLTKCLLHHLSNIHVPIYKFKTTDFVTWSKLQKDLQ